MKKILTKIKLKRFAKLSGQFLAVLLLMVIFTNLSVFITTAHAADSLIQNSALPVDTKTLDVYKAGQIPTPAAGQGGQAIIQQAILGGLEYVKIITVVIGILLITIMAYTLVSSGSQEEEVTKAKRGMIYTIVAFAMISMSQNFAKIFDMSSGTLLGSPQEILNRVHLFDKQVEIVVTFIKYIIGTYAAFQLVRSGIKLVTGGSNEEDTGKYKKSILYSAGGLILLYVGDIFINKVFFKVDKTQYSGITGVHPMTDAKAGVEQIVGITNFIVSFVGPIAVLMLIAGAIMYASSGGADEQMQKAKRIITTAAIGIVIIFGAFALVSTVLAGRLQDMNTLMK